jgi:glycolate oxidase FAD binding subunit
MSSERAVLSPSSTSDVAAMLTDAAEQQLTVLPRGAGLGWHDPDADIVIDTRRMDKVVEHAAGDLVARVQAGATMGHVAEVLAKAGQRLALDVPPDVTVGGMIATGLAGPLRFRYGSPRDLLLGVTVVRPDGVVARSGGKVVKNVAGYDLGKLFAGSHGTLGLITEATFRLHPIPKAVAYVTAHWESAGTEAAIDVSGVVGAAASSHWQPSAIELGPGQSVGILLEGTPDGVAQRAEEFTRIPRVAGLTGIAVSPTPPPWWGRLPGAADNGTVPVSPVVRVTFWQNKLIEVLELIGKSAVDLAVGGSAGAGLLYLVGETDEEFLTALRGTLAGRGSVRVLTNPPSFDHPLMYAVRDQFDPEHRMKGAG